MALISTGALTVPPILSVPGPASMVTPSMRRHVHVSVISLVAHVCPVVVAVLVTVPGMTNTAATASLPTASGDAIIIKQHLVLLFTSWHYFKSIF